MTQVGCDPHSRCLAVLLKARIVRHMVTGSVLLEKQKKIINKLKKKKMQLLSCEVAYKQKLYSMKKIILEK